MSKELNFILFIVILNFLYLTTIYKNKEEYQNSKIKLGILANSLKNGGVERQTSLLLNYLNQYKFIQLTLFTRKEKENNEYLIDLNIKRIVANDTNNLLILLKSNEIDILIYQEYALHEMIQFNQLKKPKIIYINRSSFLHWIYYNSYERIINLYKIYQNSSYIISLVPFENDYLFKKWGIHSILMDNFIPFNLSSIIPSDLSGNLILMIGRGDDKIKRFELGIESMKYIIREINNCELKIISIEVPNLIKLCNELGLQNNIKFVNYTEHPEYYYKNASLHIFPTLAEAFPNILSETLIYGIPNILLGLDYVSAAKGGTVILYDDSPLSLAKEAILILQDEKLRKKLGKEARDNIGKYNNDDLCQRWVKLILSIHKNGKYYKYLSRKEKRINNIEALNILQNQIKLIRMRKKEFTNISLNYIENFENYETFITNIKM